MTHEEMSNFTYEELSNFWHFELSLDKTDLLQKMINDFREDIPSRIILKLESLCKNFITSCENNNIEVSQEIVGLKNKKHFSIIDILSVLASITSIISFIMSMFSSSEKTINNTYINQITNYAITEEYITDIDIIINELEQTYNITIETYYAPNNTNTEY